MEIDCSNPGKGVVVDQNLIDKVTQRMAAIKSGQMETLRLQLANNGSAVTILTVGPDWSKPDLPPIAVVHCCVGDDMLEIETVPFDLYLSSCEIFVPKVQTKMRLTERLAASFAAVAAKVGLV